MNIEITGLSDEIENYRSRMMTLYWNVRIPRKITYNWKTYIEPANLYSRGEDGAYAYLKGRALSEESLILFAIYADDRGQPEMANGFWKRAYLKSKSHSEPLSTKKKKADSIKAPQPAKAKAPLSLREWLFTLMRRQGNYSCYSIFLVLPSNKEAIHYLEELSTELKIISNETNSLVVALGGDQHLRSDVDGETWSSIIKNDIQKGFSAKIGRLFGLDFTQYPCLVVFRSLNSSEQILITLRGMTAEDIAEKMKSIFSIIQRAVDEDQSPLGALHRNQNNERLRNAGNSLVIGIRYIADTTFKAVMEALANAQLNKPFNP